MIAMGLLFLMLLYIVLFIVVGLSAKRWATRLFGWGILLTPLVWKTWDIPVGYYHFQKLCEAEAGFKIYEPNPVPAKVIKLDTQSHSGETLLKRRPSLQGVEAQDQKYEYLSKPMAFALYERDADGQVVSSLLDKVGKKSGKGEVRVLESVPSNADYIFTENLDYPADRMSRQIQQLRRKDGTLIGSSVSLKYMWSNPAKTLFADSFHTSRCGPPMETSDREYEQLLDLIAPNTK